ncbi:MAG: DMT family transporter [Holophagaceae bacterium]|uniref:DMT family transporter n=1 Tax=Candidatus Geothrix skivensis TaxID=2954439 RepID=A0A9D7SJM7_9BACT|nr:DMT family transporter [Candidatus Geothrix skivensis]
MPYLGESAALLTSLCWSLNSVCFTVAGRRVGSAAVNLGRLLMAWGTLLLVHLVIYGSLFPMQAGGARLGWLALSGFIGFALGDAVLFEAFVLIGARLAMLLMTLSPIFSALLAWLFLGQNLSLPKLLAMAVTLGGIAWVVWGGGEHEEHPHLWRGILLGIGGALGQSIGLVCSKFGLAGDFPPISANLIRVTAGVVALLLYFGFRGQIRSTLGALRDGRATAFIGLGAATGPVLGVVLSLIAIAKAPMGVAATLMSLSPVILLPVSHFVFKEKVGGHAILGTLLALGGAAALFFL